MYMTATKVEGEGRVSLKLNIHEYGEEDIDFLGSLGIDQEEYSKDKSETRLYKLIASQDEFLATRKALLERYTVLEEKGPRVYIGEKMSI